MIEIIDLQLFADKSDKTEKATAKKRQDARKKGQVHQSQEITTAMVLMVVFVTLRIYGGNIYDEIIKFTKMVLTEYPKIDDLFMPDIIVRVFIDSVIVFLKTVGPILAVALLTGLAVSYAQVGVLFTLETLKFKFERINPIAGFQRMFSIQGLVQMVKSILKVTVIGFVAYSYFNSQVDDMMRTMDMDVISIAAYIGMTSLNIAIRICVSLILLGVLDYAYQWWQHEKNLKMSKQEIKEEYKQTEGNPEIKSKLKQQQRQISMRRMMAEVPKADVVITNPTHYACVIKYDANISSAPILTAKGQDYIALRIREIAKENKVQIVENKPLARTLFETVDIGKAVPPEMYQAVAEVLAFVYSLKGKNKAV